MTSRHRIVVGLVCTWMTWAGAIRPAAVLAQTGTTDTTTATTDSGGTTASSDSSDSSGTSDSSSTPETTETGWVAPAAPGSGTGTGLTARPFYVGAGAGFAAGLSGAGGVLFAAEEGIGYRFFGFHLGDALDGAIFAGLSFGQVAGSNFIGLQFDVRGGVDLEVWDGGNLQLLVTPSITLGGGAFIVSFTDLLGNTSTSTAGAFDFGFSTQGELVMLDGLLGLWLRPLSFELYIASGVGALYELLAGVNIRL